MRVYLAGGINGLTDAECNEWRSQAREMLACDVADPMSRDCRGREAALMNEIVEGDKADILSCSHLLVNAVRPSWGTAMEVLFAYDQSIPVVAFGTDRPSPWLSYHARHVVLTLTEAVECLKRIMP